MTDFKDIQTFSTSCQAEDIRRLSTTQSQLRTESGKRRAGTGGGEELAMLWLREKGFIGEIYSNPGINADGETSFLGSKALGHPRTLLETAMDEFSKLRFR